MKPRILLATPLRGSPLLPYMTGIVECLALQDAHYILSILPSTYVTQGRNHAVGEARKHGCDEIIFIDSDMSVKPEHILKLRSYDVDIVGGLYCKRKSGDPEWTCHATGEPAVGDLIPVNDVGTGLLRIKMRVFDKFDEVFTGRKYQNGDAPALLTEYFPMGLTVGDGWQHPAEDRLDAISAVLMAWQDAKQADVPISALKPLLASKATPVRIVGEDCSFCRMAKHAGFQPWVDVTCQIRHVGEASYPLVETPLT